MKKYLTTREFEILCILWDADKPLAASQIQAQSEELKAITIQNCLTKLLEYEYIRVADIVQITRSFARIFEPVISPVEYLDTMIAPKFPPEWKTDFYKHAILNLIDSTEDVDEADVLIEGMLAFLEEQRKRI